MVANRSPNNSRPDSEVQPVGVELALKGMLRAIGVEPPEYLSAYATAETESSPLLNRKNAIRFWIFILRI